MTKTIVHILPQNSTICGGIKVHYQMSELEKELGYASFVAFPDLNDVPTWFNHKCDVIDYTHAKGMLGYEGGGIVIGWEDLKVLREFDIISRKVAYIQGEALLDHYQSFSGVDVWYSSKWNKDAMITPGDIINPFIDPLVFHPVYYRSSESPLLWLLPLSVMFQRRKSGEERWNQVIQYLPEDMVEKCLVGVSVPDVSEKQFAQHMRHNHIFFAHSYPEGFGLPALEAMACGMLVMGYAGGGAREFMEPMKTAFVANDGDAATLAKHLATVIVSAQNKSWGTITPMQTAAMAKAATYTREATKKQLENALLRLSM